VPSVSVAGVDLPVADDIKVLGVVLDRRLLFHKHVSAVARSCNYHQTHFTPADYGTGTDTGLYCYPVQDRLLQCCAPLRSKLQHQLQRVQNNAARIVLEASRRSHVSPFLRTLHWLPVQQRIDYKVALLTFKVHSTSTPLYLRLLIQDREHCHNQQSTTTVLRQPFTTTTLAADCVRNGV